jgi:hypothetical protein
MLIKLARDRVSMALPVATLVLVLMVAFMVVLLVFICRSWFSQIFQLTYMPVTALK